MPIFRCEELEQFVVKVLLKVGAAEDEAHTVARHIVGANLSGHDSHGILQLPIYLQRVKVGHIRPGAPFVVERESATTAIINGNWGFGQVVSSKAAALAIQKAQAHDMAAITIHYQSHVGRVADYPVMLAKAGMIGIMACDSGRTAKYVVPFWGTDKRLGTNPLCIAMPSNQPGPVFIDMATSAVAANKVVLAQARHQPVPPGWIVDARGQPTTDPGVLSAGGALLPLGADRGHKGYGLSFMVEILTGILPGLGFGHDPKGAHNDGSFLMAVKVAAFRPLEEFKREVDQFVAYLKASPPIPGVKEVLYPGEPEYLSEQERRRDGILVEEETVGKLQQLAKELNLTEHPFGKG